MERLIKVIEDNEDKIPGDIIDYVQEIQERLIAAIESNLTSTVFRIKDYNLTNPIMQPQSVHRIFTSNEFVDAIYKINTHMESTKYRLDLSLYGQGERHVDYLVTIRNKHKRRKLFASVERLSDRPLKKAKLNSTPSSNVQET